MLRRGSWVWWRISPCRRSSRPAWSRHDTSVCSQSPPDQHFDLCPIPHMVFREPWPIFSSHRKRDFTIMCSVDVIGMLWQGKKRQQLLLPVLFFKDNKWKIPEHGFSSAWDAQKFRNFPIMRMRARHIFRRKLGRNKGHIWNGKGWLGDWPTNKTFLLLDSKLVSFLSRLSSS